MFSNVSTPDCTITNKQRGDRALELGQTVVSGVEHGWTGRFIEVYEYAKANGLKPLFGTEAYFVKNRLEKDRTNAHVMLLAKNEAGRQSINWILSEANVTGYYYKARIDQELLLTLDPKNVWVTTSCLGGVWKYEDHEEIIASWKNHFGDSLFLEVQPHDTEEQRDLNRKVLTLSKKFNIKIIAGMDSHMIYPEQAKERDDYLLSRGIEYPEESGWYLDYPSYDEAVKRFIHQGVLSKDKVVEALENTTVLTEVEPYVSIIFDDKKIKLPTLYPEKTDDEKFKVLKDIIWSEWKEERMNVPFSKWGHYEQEIKKELKVVEDTKMSDYFILDYEIIKRGKEKGGSITMTGRGSAPSFYITKLLGFTTIDRIGASVKLFPERFISKERLLETMSIPDIDFNLGTPKIFAEAQEEILGCGHSYQMIAFGTVRTLGAWKLYSRVAGVDFDVANNISEQIQKYESDIKHSDSPDDIFVHDYIDEKYHDVFDESRKYLGLVNTITPHPCAFLLFTDDDVRRQFGLLKIKTGNVEHLCANVDGLFAEKYKLLKNDLLKVSVVDLIHRVYKRIGIEPHTLPELLKLCDSNKDVWGIYERALGVGINQVEQSGTIGRVAQYKPKNISELSAFVAAIRPGFKSNYKQFEERQQFSYGIPAIDALIQTEEFPQSYMLYQENAMQIMAYAGIPVSETYDVIKNIAKKRADKVYKYKDIFIDGMTSKIMNEEKYSKEDAEKISHDTWQIIEDSAFYSFNASHSYAVAGDSLYGAYLKAMYPYEFYEVLLNMLEDDGDKDRLARAKSEAEKGFGIRFPSYKFGQDNTAIVADKEKKTISSSIKSIKGFNEEIGKNLYEMSKVTHETFIDLLIYADEHGMLSSKFEKLILINYFSMFGNNKKLLALWNEFKTGKNRYSSKLTQKSKEKRIPELKKMELELPNESISFMEQIDKDVEITGNICSVYPEIDKHIVCVMEVADGEGLYAPRVEVRVLKTGKMLSLKIKKAVFSKNIVASGQIINCKAVEKKQTVKYVNGDYVPVPNDFTYWLNLYETIKDIDKYIGKK